MDGWIDVPSCIIFRDSALVMNLILATQAIRHVGNRAYTFQATKNVKSNLCFPQDESTVQLGVLLCMLDVHSKYVLSMRCSYSVSHC